MDPQPEKQSSGTWTCLESGRISRGSRCKNSHRFTAIFGILSYTAREILKEGLKGDLPKPLAGPFDTIKLVVTRIQSQEIRPLAGSDWNLWFDPSRTVLVVVTILTDFILSVLQSSKPQASSG